MFAGNEAVEEVKAGDSCQIVLDRTPFYAESGGQVSDGGTLTAPGTAAVVEEVFKAPHGQHVLVVRVTEGSLRTGMNVQAAVARAEREDIVKNHTATHLLHKALKQVLGEHVNQAGSLVEAERLRFDFTHLGAIQPDELQDIERRVNEQIWNGIGVVIESKAIDEAKAMGAMALFGEKYGDIVRVVQVGDYSIELCGGCHVRNTSEIGLFKVVSESGIGSGVRRLEAVTGRHAYQYMESQLELLKQAAGLLKANAADVPKRVEGMFAREKELARENESLKAKLSSLEAGQLTDRVRSVAGIPVLAAQVDAGGMDALRTTADELKAKLPGSVIALASAADGKVNLVVAVAPELVKQGLHAAS